MKIDIHGKNGFETTPAIKEYIEDKFKKVKMYFNDIEDVEARVVCKVYPAGHKVEVTIPIKHFILRAEDTESDMYAAVDLVLDKIERQIRKYKAKVNRSLLKTSGIKDYFQEATNEEKIELDDNEIMVAEKIVKRKPLSLKPMDIEEALLQMEMLGHDFFVYQDVELATPCIIYRRKDGKYGVIET